MECLVDFLFFYRNVWLRQNVPLYLVFKESFDIVNNVKYDVNDMPKPGLLVGLSFQHLFAMFGATVLVPIGNFGSLDGD